MERLSFMLGVSPLRLAQGVLGVVLISLPVGLLFGFYAWVAAVAFLGATGVGFVTGIRCSRRAALDRDLPALLTALASSVRAGLDPVASMVSSSHYLPARTPLAEGLEKLSQRLKSGSEELSTIEGFLSEWRHPDVELFKRCLILSRKHGSSLAEPLHRITRVVRQRQSFRRKTKAALAMHRLSAVGIALCGVLIGVVQVSMNIEGVKSAVSHPMGAKLLLGGGALIASGLVWMMSLGSEEIS
jgi:Flp pilus assembly protein TadB